MSQQSEERLPDSAGAAAHAASSARILQFERRQSSLQRAIQLRAQEAIDRDREIEREVKRPQPVKWAVGLLAAMIPVILILGAVDGFLRVLQKVGETYSSMSAPATPQQPQQQQQQQQAPAASQPGIVMLQPYKPQPGAKPDAKQAKPAGGSATAPKEADGG